MKRLLFAATMLATLLVSCMKSEIEVVTVIPSSEEFTASFDDATRTELDGTAVVWNENDLLTIFTKTSHNRKYEIKSLSTDCRTATFSYVGFTGTDGTKITTNYALYPYDAEATLANGVITTEWASEQTYDADTGNLSYALMVAKSETTNFSFTNAGALLRFKLSKIVPDDFTLRYIKLTSATQKIAGETTIDLNGNKRAIVTDNGVDNIYLDAINTEITLDVQEFYIALPAMSFDKGDLSVTFMFDEGNKEFALPAFELMQGSIKNIEYTIKDAEEFTGSTPGDTPTNNEIWYTNGSTTEATTPYKTDAFGANILSNTYDAEKECWVIKFDGDVTKIGTQAFYDCSSLTSVTIPDSITTIGRHAFSNCGGLTSVTIPNSVTTIGEAAFINCSQLQEFKGKFASSDGRCLIVNGQLCSFAPGGLTGYNIPDSVTTIGSHAFSSCIGLTSVTIPDSVTTIGEYAFGGCSGLTSVTIPDSVTTIEEGTFYNCYGLTSVTIPDSVTTIGEYAFRYCDSLTSVNIPDSVTTIEEGTFYYCESLTSVTIPDSVTTIGNYAFINCLDLTSITIPDSVTTIGEYAFDNCSSLTSVTIPNSVTTIGEAAFSNCSQLQEFKGKFASDDGRCLIQYGKLIAFAPAELTEYAIPDGVTTIGEAAFFDCSSLTSITIPDSVTTIGDLAFYYCTSLTSVTIPDSVTSIGDWAFYHCDSLTSVYCEATTPPTGGYDMFDFNASDRKIYVPRNSVEAYKSASGWSEYADSIVAYDFENGKVVVSNEIWYTNGSTTEATTPNKTDVFGANILSNTYDAEKECWVIKFDGDVTKIGTQAFYSRSSLTSITIPDSVTTIDGSAFAGCSGLTSVNIPNSVTTIGAYAFSSCCGLTSVTIPDSVTTIGSNAFINCHQLQEFMGKFASDDGRCLIQYGKLIAFAPAELTEYAIPDGVTTIGPGAFYACDDLTSITIPDSVTTIGESAFHCCSSLTSVNIPDSVTTIDSDAFGGCSGLTSVTIPDSVTSIGDEAFGYCPSLKEVYCKPTTPPTGGSSMFDDNASGRKIYVPCDSVEAYKAADAWDAYADDIYSYDFENNSI